MKEEFLNMMRSILDEHGEKKNISDEEKIKAAYALNMCMVSVSQIIDYDDLHILDQEYDGILNNLNLEMMPKDEALLSVLKQILDTITFFRLQEGDRKILDKEYQQKMKNAIWSAVPNFSLIVAGGSPVTMAVSLASQVGIGYMNYRRAKAENSLEYEKNLWHLQRSAMEQFNGLRRELFDTAWRLADAYQFPDEYRLTERQIKQYNEILMDADEIRKYERLTAVKDCFKAYPPFWYHYGSTANHIARNEALPLSLEARGYYKTEAMEHFKTYWSCNKYALLREDMMAASCALEYADLLNLDTDRDVVLDLLDKAVKFSGKANDVLQLCAISYLKIGERKKSAKILRILVNEEYNTIINGQLLSGLYVHESIYENSLEARTNYETLVMRVKSDYLYRMPLLGEKIDAQDLKDEFDERQEDLLLAKFDAVIQCYFSEFCIKLGKIIPGINPHKNYPDYYFSEEGKEQRYRDFNELFSSSFKQRWRADYLSDLKEKGIVNLYFEELNRFFGEITELNCIRDRQKLQEIINQKIINNRDSINSLANKIEEKKISKNDMIHLMEFTSIHFFGDFIAELKHQINETVLGMTSMLMYAAADTKLRDFCMTYGIPEPDKLIEEGQDAESDIGLDANYFGMELLNSQEKLQESTKDNYRQIESVIRRHEYELNTISNKSNVYFHNSTEFNSYFENSKLKKHKDILRKTIAVFDDKGLQNVDVLFTVDGLVPVVRNTVKTTIPYIALASGAQKKAVEHAMKAVVGPNKKDAGVLGATIAIVPGWGKMAIGGAVAFDTNAVNHIIKAAQPMIDEICEVIISTFKQ